MPFCRRRSLSTRAPPPNPCSTDRDLVRQTATLFQMPRRGRYLTQVRDEMLARGIKWCDVSLSNPSRYLPRDHRKDSKKKTKEEKSVERNILRERNAAAAGEDKTTGMEFTRSRGVPFACFVRACECTCSYSCSYNFSSVTSTTRASLCFYQTRNFFCSCEPFLPFPFLKTQTR